MNKKYNIIYADPPWNYAQIGNRVGGRTNPYKAMRFVDICELPIREISDDDCVLFLWITLPLLPEGLFLLKQWGFEYKTVAFTWVKRNKKADSWFWGMGSWTRSNPEICLLGIKGDIKVVSHGVHSVIDDRIREHSRKPDTARERIVELMGDIPRIELFAREKTEGWDVWGNEVKSDVKLDDYR